jgi:dTDP-4-dehydrorhamnose 3,5-epimerase
MQIVSAEQLAIPEIHVVQFRRFRDDRGYFTEHMRRSDLDSHPETRFLNGVPFVQMNESYSRAGTIRGLHFQWNPYMGKLVRTIHGHMIDLVLDIRKGSATFGKIIAFDMPADTCSETGTWIWVPPGFAHGNAFPQDTTIEYLCSGEYSPGCEAGISPFAEDIDWSLCDPDLRRAFDDIAVKDPLISDKDRNAFSLESWLQDERSSNFEVGTTPMG